ncbi:hypothetical protein SHKM778_50460 [Streptomyces sp. KM77-8]|uniref:Uncharacterized protein n=1 Tax=Streptomyces haneummycinicus TaxID=3074435 RepID=A0AAT9HMJ5_9ACTN
MALPSEAAFTARLTARSSVTVMSERRNGGFRRRWSARSRAGCRLTAADGGVGSLSVGDVARSFPGQAMADGTYQRVRNEAGKRARDHVFPVIARIRGQVIGAGPHPCASAALVAPADR